MTSYSGEHLESAVREAGLRDWVPTPEGLRTRYLSGDFAKGLELVNRIGEAAEKANHHPDLALTYSHLDVQLMSHDVDAVTDRDLDLAREISRLAAAMGISAGQPDD